MSDFHELQDKAYEEAHDNPTTDHELLELLGSGELVYDENAEVKGPEEFEGWDEGRED